MCLLISLFLLAGCAAEPAEPAATGFLEATDGSGTVILGYQKQENDWYLFVPSTVKIPELTLRCGEPIAEVSAGTQNPETSAVTGAFRESGDRIQMTMASGEKFAVTVLQSGLPSVQLRLDGGSLQTIHDNKDTRVRVSSFSLTEPGGAGDLVVKSGAEIKGRGNTSWSLYEKKGYQIRFDVKTSVLGMERAKKWVLLANAGDDSMMRVKLVHDLAQKMDMGYVPEFEYVDLWIDGAYLGTYLLGEKAEIGTGRLDLRSSTGVLLEHDENYFAEEERWFVNNTLRRHFTVKEIAVETDSVMDAAEDAFNERLDSLMYYLYTTLPRDVTLERMAQDIDVDSFAKYYLINDYVLNCESFATSFYWHQDGAGDVLHMGPVWDFDTCMGNDGMTPADNYGQQHLLFTYLLASPAFRQRTEEIYRQYRDAFAAMETESTELENLLEASARMNYTRWDVLGQANAKPGSKVFHETFAQAADFVRSWLRKRQTLFQIPECLVVNSIVSEDCRTMDLYYEDGEHHDSVVFAAWKYYSDGENKAWVQAQETDGVWHAQVDMTRVNDDGMFRIDVLRTGEDTALASGRNIVKKAVSQDYVVEAYLTDNGATLTVDMQDNLGNCQGVAFAMWGEENAQDDLVWLHAAQNAEGIWTVSTPTAELTENGVYHIHAWGNRGLPDYEFLEGVSEYLDYPMDAAVDPEAGTMRLVLDDYNTGKAVSFAVWSLIDNQQDIFWTDAVKNADGLWECTVDIAGFGPDALIAVHAYGNATGQDYRFLKEMIVGQP